jgi:hypothetical protein
VKGECGWHRLSFPLGWAVTCLTGKRGRPVLAIPDAVLDELRERGNAFSVLPESQLRRHLTPGGLAWYRHLRRQQPEHLSWNAPLPSALHVAMTCNVAEEHVEAVRRIMDRYQPVAFRTRKVTVLAITLAPDEPEDVRTLVQVEFTVPRGAPAGADGGAHGQRRRGWEPGHGDSCAE